MFRCTKRLALVAASALLAFATGLEAQSPVAGTYVWEFDAMIRRGGDGTETTNTRGQAKLTLEVKGDSIFGTFGTAMPSMPGMGEMRPREFKGTVKGNTVQFTITSQARIVVNGDAQSVDTHLTYTATVDGDVIKGTIDTEAGDTFRVPQRTFEGKRLKS